eukprot:CAMPEP_0179425666 /NCGR_PEP_ID=MMETSP0799-20121207/12301_1 /TAXON_ID=46947 /ORGANISM="Geminigera cryophila, Strain CCMP2564" /LENGTH=612 /DNA_ID=CAMNT_0021200315 /DNA_START=23 /DNA_END=1858 /DNA_ORIENTATION=+
MKEHSSVIHRRHVHHMALGCMYIGLAMSSIVNVEGEQKVADELKTVRERIAAVRMELQLEKVRQASRRTPHLETASERFLQDSRGAPYNVDKSYHEELDRNGNTHGNTHGNTQAFAKDAAPVIDMDYCMPSFANSHFAPSYSSNNLALHKIHTTSSVENNAVWLRHGAAALDGDLCTKWASVSDQHEWLVIDLGAPHELHNLSIFWDIRSYATDYIVETSLDHTFEKFARAPHTQGTSDSKSGNPEQHILFQTLAAPFSADPTFAAQARQRFRRRLNERYVHDLLLVAGLPWSFARFIRIAAVRSSSSSSSSSSFSSPTSSSMPILSNFGIHEIIARGQRVGQMEVARVLIAAVERARVVQERDLLVALHHQLSRQNEDATKNRVSELALKAETALNELRAQGEDGGEGGISEIELQRMLGELQDAIKPPPLVTQSDEEKQRRATQTQARSWQDRTWLGDGGSSHSSNSQMPPTFVSRWDESYRTISAYRSMFSVAHAVHDESMHQEGERCMSQWGSEGSEGGLRVDSKVALASRHFEPLKDSETVTREEPEEMGEAEMNGDGEEDTEIETVVAADGQVAGMEEMKTHLWSTFSVAELLEGGGGQGVEELDG